MEDPMKQIEDTYAGFEAGFKQAHEDIDGAETLLAIVADMKNDLTPLNNYFVYEKLDQLAQSQLVQLGATATTAIRSLLNYVKRRQQELDDLYEARDKWEEGEDA